MIDKSPIDLEKIEASRVMRPPGYIIIHHSATVDGKTFSWPAIKKYHMDKGWSDIGYNLGVELVKDTVRVVYGRLLTHNPPGAHCKGIMNRESVGICVVGNYDAKPPSADHWTQALRLTRAVASHFRIPFANVQGHRDYAPRSCPGKMFDMDKFRNDLKLSAEITAREILKGTLTLAGGLYDVEMRIKKIW